MLACAPRMPTYHTPMQIAAAQAVATGANVAASELKVEAPPKPELGDLAVGCFAIARATQQNPAALAQQIASGFEPTDLLASATATGPFVNFRLHRPAAFRWIVDAALTATLLPRAVG